MKIREQTKKLATDLREDGKHLGLEIEFGKDIDNWWDREEPESLSPLEIYKLILKNEFKAFPKNTWNKPESFKNGCYIIRYLIEDVLNWTEDDIRNELSGKIFVKNHLGGMLSQVFKNSPFYAIDAAYPGRFKAWELKQKPHGFWTLENGIKATKWLFEEKLKWNDQEIKNNLSVKIFNNNCLGGMLFTVFRESVFQAIEASYPGRFKEWELINTPNNFWNLETGVKAVKWLVEEKLKCLPTDITKKMIKENGLYGLLQIVFHNNVRSALIAAYPEYKKKLLNGDGGNDN